MEDNYYDATEIKRIVKAVKLDAHLMSVGIALWNSDRDDFDVCLPKNKKCSMCKNYYKILDLDDHRACIIETQSSGPLFGGVKEPMLLADERIVICHFPTKSQVI